jgi:Type VI secretion system/phage-baseplate injector OB domain
MQEQNLTYEMMDLMEDRFFGKYRGLVKDNQDPTGCGRLAVIVPAVMGDEEIWAWPCVPYAGNNMGLYAIPEPETGVWVEFEAGDPSYPIWVGCFWADGQAPKNERGTEASPPLKIIRSRKGLMITLDDEQQVITMSDKDGDNLITIQVEQRQVTLKGAQKVVVEAPLIELVENATQPVVFGDKLLQYLNSFVRSYLTHTHSPPGAPPAPPPPPLPTRDLISSRVKTG